MRWLRFSVIVLIATILQAALVGVLSLTRLDIKPNLLLILLVFFAVYSNSYDSVITSFVIGFAADLIGSGNMGSQMIAFGIFGTVLGNMHRVLSVSNMPYQSATIFVVSLGVLVMAHYLSFVNGSGGMFSGNVWTFIMGQSLYTAVVGPFLFVPVRWCMGTRPEVFSRY